MPVTLGGTSNHFKTKIIKKYKWDSYNVTEDADLGILLWLKGYQIIINDSKTLEEAPASILSWVKQRSRWIKGFLQTYFVYIKNNNHKNLNFFNRMKFLFWINCFILFPILSQFLSIIIPIKFILLKYFFGKTDFFNLFFKIYICNFLFYYISHIIILFLNSKNLSVKIKFIDYLIFPLYLFLNIFATYRALWQFFSKKQYYWEKTLHGLSGIEK